jgi:hypothetical protein
VTVDEPIHALHENLEAEWLLQYCERACRQPGNMLGISFALAGPTCHKQNPDVRLRLDQRSGELRAAFASRENDIGDEAINSVPIAEPFRFLRGACRHDVVSPLLKNRCKEVADRLFVFDNQDSSYPFPVTSIGRAKFHYVFSRRTNPLGNLIAAAISASVPSITLQSFVQTGEKA